MGIHLTTDKFQEIDWFFRAIVVDYYLGHLMIIERHEWSDIPFDDWIARLRVSYIRKDLEYNNDGCFLRTIEKKRWIFFIRFEQ